MTTMTRTATLSDDQKSRLNTLIDHESLRQVAARAGVHHATLSNALQGKAVRQGAIVALSKVMPKVRTSNEFRGQQSYQTPRPRTDVYSWTLAAIRAARDQQLAGDFEQPCKLAKAMRTDDALFTAYHRRIDPQASIQTRLVPAKGARGKAIAAKAAAAITVERSVLMGIQGTMVNHGLAIGYVERTVNASGTLVSMRLTEWPLEFVRWDPVDEQLETQVRDGGARVPITHGDGRWIVFARFKAQPWTQEACLLPAALVWAAHAEGISAWAGGANAHGLAQIVGKLPQGFAVEDENGNLTPQARAFLELIRALSSGETGAGIAPPGSEIDFLSNGSTAWQIFETLTLGREKAAARIYQGTDAALGSVGGAPGVDISALFGVATTKLQGDFEAIEVALKTGLYEPWTAINEGTSQYAPSLKYQLPDPDADAKSTQNASKHTRLTTAIRELRDAGLEVTQADVDQLASEFNVSPAPRLNVATTPTPPATPATPQKLSATTGTIQLEVTHRPAGTPEGGQFAPGGTGTTGGGGHSEAPKHRESSSHKSLVSKAKDVETALTKKAHEKSAELKPKLKQASDKAKKAEERSAKDFSGDPPQQAYDLVNAREHYKVVQENSGGRGTNAFNDSDVRKAESRLANAKTALANAAKDAPEGAIDRLNEAADARAEADDIQAEYDSASKFAKQSNARKKALSDYEEAVKRGDRKGVSKAQQKIGALISDDNFAGRDEPIDSSFTKIIDGDGDGLLNEDEDE